MASASHPTLEAVTDTMTNVSIASVLANQMVRSVYQPIFDLESGEIVAYEALARGPVGTKLEHPAQLFAAADRSGVRAELDWECRAAALRGAIAAGVGRETCLFINLEASSFRDAAPAHLAAEIEAATSQLNVIAEIAEHDLVKDPVSLMHQLSGLRGLGFGLAIDDLGANSDSMALLPFLEPDIIKLDMRLLQYSNPTAVAAISAAVRSDAERRGSLIVAEAIETDDQLRRAKVLGATLGQGWLFARPGPLEDVHRSSAEPSPLWERLVRGFHPSSETPWGLVAGSPEVRVASKELLLSMSMTIEEHPSAADEPPVLVSARQHSDNFDPATAHRYRERAKTAAFVGAIGEGMPTTPAPGVRGGTLGVGHPLTGEWAVVNVGPHYAGALLAKDLGDASGPEAERCYEYVITHDRDVVISAATSLLRLIEPTQLRPERRP